MLDFYNVYDIKRKNVLCSVSEDLFLSLDKELRIKQISIDLYGTTRLYKSHIEDFIEILRNKKLNKSDLYSFLLEAIEKKIGLIIEGN